MDEELLEAELSRLEKKRTEAIKELDFLIGYAEGGNIVSAAILKGIKKRLK